MKFSKNYIITICSSVLFFSISDGKEQEMRQPDDFSELDRKILMNKPSEMVNDIRFLLQNPKTTVWARETLLQNLSFLKRGDYLKKNLDLLKKYNFDSAQHTGILLAKISESYHSFLLTPTSVYACQSTYRHDQGRWELSLQRHEGNFNSMWESAARTLKKYPNYKGASNGSWMDAPMLYVCFIDGNKRRSFIIYPSFYDPSHPLPPEPAKAWIDLYNTFQKDISTVK